MSALIFILILSFLVIIHELGHFLVARWAKITVEEFGLGYPPRAKTLAKDKRGTIYSLNWLPFGGFVRMLGEDSSEVRSTEYVVRSDNKNREFSFSEVPAWKRMLVILAGASVNFVFGVVAFGLIYSRHGIPTPLNGVRIEAVAPESPAAKSGITIGSLVTQIQYEQDSVDTTSSQSLIQFVQQHRGQQLTLETQTGQSYLMYVRTPQETPEGQGSLGVTLSDTEMKFYPWWQMPFRGMWVGMRAAVEFGGLILQALGKMLSELVMLGKVPADVAGPVGIVYSAEKEGFLKEGFWAQLNFAAILSINLAIMNVLPFPALDGGRAVFIVWEMVTRRRVKPKIEAWLNTAGFMLLISLIVLISFRDVGRVFGDPQIQGWFKGLFH